MIACSYNNTKKKKVDVYSATMVLYTMFLGEVPFKNMDGMAFAEHSARQASSFFFTKGG